MQKEKSVMNKIPQFCIETVSVLLIFPLASGSSVAQPGTAAALSAFKIWRVYSSWVSSVYFEFIKYYINISPLED